MKPGQPATEEEAKTIFPLPGSIPILNRSAYALPRVGRIAGPTFQ
jgi:hypothetical protein